MTTKEAYAIARSMHFPQIVLEVQPRDVIRHGEAAWDVFRMSATHEQWQKLFRRLEHWKALMEAYEGKRGAA